MTTLTDFNTQPDEIVRRLLTACVRIRSWSDALLADRPYDSIDALVARAATLAEAWTDAEVDEALADHPRIGEKPTATSRREQALVPDALTRLLAEANQRYEERFGRIYLVRAHGRTGEELLDLLVERLQNSPEVERVITREQLSEIALLRLTHSLQAGVPA